jgi:O-antigen ligase
MISYLPITLFLAVGWFLSEPVSLLAICVLTFWVLTGIVIKANISWLIGVGQFFLLALVGLYFVSTFRNSNNLAFALTGNYQRNFGVWYFAVMSLLFIWALNSGKNVFKSERMLLVLLSLALTYGTSQVIGIDPIQWVNPYEAVQLTQGNPNFAGALLGMLIVVPFAKLIQARKFWKRFMYGFLVLFTLFMCFQTQSLQSIIVALFGSLIYLYIFSLNSEKNIFKAFNVYLKMIFASTSLIVISIVLFKFRFLDGLREVFYFQGSIPQRLDYWRTGIEMFFDNWILGVGPDQFQRYAALYRNSEQVLRDGDFVIPDRAHNVLIDHLANGGIGAGILWLVFCIYIFYRLYLSSKNELSQKNRNLIGMFGGIWTGYFIQSLLSPDQILLSVIGFMSAGYVVQLSRISVPAKDNNQSQFSAVNDPIYIRTIFGSILVFAIFFWSQILSSDISGKRILDNETLNPDVIEKEINNWTSPELIEKITFAVSQVDTQCGYVPSLADRLIQADDRSASGWYFKAVCSNLNKEFDLALEYVGKSLSLDPINPVFLVAQGKLAIAAGNKSVGIQALEILKKQYPENPEIPLLESSLSVL